LTGNMTKWVLKIIDGKPQATSAFVKADFHNWMSKNEGKFITITPHEKVSSNKRGYFEGALIPAYCQWHEALDATNPDHRELVREMFKTEFNGTFVKGLWSEPHKIPRSTSRLNNDEFGMFLNRITDYFEENQIPVPSPELYLKWVDMFQDEEADYWTWLRKHNLKSDGSTRSDN